MVSRPDRKHSSHFLTILLEKLFVNSHLFCWNVYCATAKKRITRFMIEAVIFDVAPKETCLPNFLNALCHASAWRSTESTTGDNRAHRSAQHSANEISKSALLRKLPHRLHKS